MPIPSPFRVLTFLPCLYCLGFSFSTHSPPPRWRGRPLKTKTSRREKAKSAETRAAADAARAAKEAARSSVSKNGGERKSRVRVVRVTVLGRRSEKSKKPSAEAVCAGEGRARSSSFRGKKRFVQDASCRGSADLNSNEGSGSQQQRQKGRAFEQSRDAQHGDGAQTEGRGEGEGVKRAQKFLLFKIRCRHRARSRLPKSFSRNNVYTVASVPARRGVVPRMSFSVAKGNRVETVLFLNRHPVEEW